MDQHTRLLVRADLAAAEQHLFNAVKAYERVAKRLDGDKILHPAAILIGSGIEDARQLTKTFHEQVSAEKEPAA